MQVLADDEYTAKCI